MVKGKEIDVRDTGGTSIERKKWIRVREGTSLVIFVVALSSYDEVNYWNDENAMDTAFQVFDEQVNSEGFAETPFILFFTKYDIFREKVLRKPITAARCFNNYNGAMYDVQESLQYIKKRFNSVNRNEDRTIFMYHIDNRRWNFL